MRRALLLLLVLSAFVAGCESKYKDPDPHAMGYDYYPLEKGLYWVYQVTDTRYINSAQFTEHFQLRERVDTSFVDQTGQEIYKIVRSKRLNEQSNWLDDSVMTVAKTANMVVLTKDNTKFVKLVFPVKSGLEFIGDLFNTRMASEDISSKVRNGKEVYTIESVGDSYTLNDQVYENTAAVVQGLLENGRNFNNRFEVYAKGVGLVHRHNEIVTYESCQLAEGCEGVILKVEKGYKREEILIDYGKL